jgi:hypothetical protein
MSWYDYKLSLKIAATGYPFYSLVWDELRNRYDAPGGFLPGEPPNAI